MKLSTKLIITLAIIMAVFYAVGSIMCGYANPANWPLGLKYEIIKDVAIGFVSFGAMMAITHFVGNGVK